jgi:hypothetical protein
MTDVGSSVGRLAIRAEGKMWNAYWARPDTMENAIPVGSIVLAAVVNDPARKQAFIELMKSATAAVVKQATGAASEFGDVRVAPEHERAGHG